jgi:hypothetical protein
MIGIRIQVNYISREKFLEDRRAASTFVNGGKLFLTHPSPVDYLALMSIAFHLVVRRVMTRTRSCGERANNLLFTMK